MPVKSLFGAAIALPLLLGANVQTAAANETRSYSSEYVISAIGLRIGRSSFNTQISEDRFTINGSMRAAGLASLFSSMSGTINVDGSRSNSSMQTRVYDVRYAEGDKQKRTTVKYSGSRMTSAVNQPDRKRREKRKDWVAHKPGAINNTLDPLTALLIPASGPRDVCNRRIRSFDGVMRADYQLSFVRTIPFSTDGFSGDAVTCRAKFIPVSGYQSEKKDVKFMRDRSRIEISFAQVGDTGLYAPVTAKAQTRIGEIAVRAVRFQADG
ncbi:MAG: DUF3108 domain-containing protein [Pseudomonadota bacterium]